MPWVPAPISTGRDPAELVSYLDRELQDLSQRFNRLEESVSPIYGGFKIQEIVGPLAVGPAGISFPWTHALPSKDIDFDLGSHQLTVLRPRNYVYTLELSISAATAAEFRLYAKVNGIDYGAGIQWSSSNQTEWSTGVLTDILFIGPGTTIEMWISTAGSEQVRFYRSRLFIWALNEEL